MPVRRAAEAPSPALDPLLADAPGTWDLSHVMKSRNEPDVQALLEQLEAGVKTIEAARASLDSIRDPAEVTRLFDLATEVGEIAHRLDGYGHLEFSTDTRNGSVKAYLNRMDQITTDAGNRTRFLSLWWKGLSDERAASLLPKEGDLRYYLTRVRIFRPHTRTESEEELLSLKDVSGANALSRVRQTITSAFKFKDPKTGNEVSESELVRRARDPDPKVRVATYETLWKVYEEHEPVLSTIYQAVVTDWVNETQKIRKYRSPISARNLGNDVPDEVVETLLKVIRANTGTFHRYFAWKGKRLNLPEMTRHHLYAPLDAAKEKFSWKEAKAPVLDSFGGFSPNLREAADRVFRENHLHARIGPGKRGGAYCSTVTSRLTPYVFMNYTGEANSVSTLAHELGHAVHSILARNRHPLVAHSSLPLAETASVFGEMLLHKNLLERADAETRISLTSDKVADAYATIVRQAYFVVFEKHAHDTIPGGASSEDLQKAYLANLAEQFGPVKVPEHFRYEWTYIPHIFETPFYCYAYSFGMLLSLALYGAYEEEGDAFVPRYEGLLASGGSAGAVELLGRMGYDPRDAEFWQKGIDVVEGMVRTLEKS